MNIASAFFSFRYKQIKARFSFTHIQGLIFGLMAVGFGAIALAQSYGQVIVGLMLAGSGLGWLLPNLNLWLTAIAPLAWRGRLVSGLTTCMFFGQFFSPILSYPATSNHGIAIAYGWMGGILALMAIGIGLWPVRDVRQS